MRQDTCIRGLGDYNNPDIRKNPNVITKAEVLDSPFPLLTQIHPFAPFTRKLKNWCRLMLWNHIGAGRIEVSRNRGSRQQVNQISHSMLYYEEAD